MKKWLEGKQFVWLLFGVAVLPRLVSVGRYITPDELIWVYRSIQFRQALLAGDWAGTLVAGHPGVMTLWCGTVGISLQLLFSASAQESYTWLTHMAYFMPDNMAAFDHLASFLSVARVIVILVNSLGVVGVYGLAERIFGRFPAQVAALFIALDPFTVGLSGLLHVDALMSTFALLALLALAAAVSPGQQPHSGKLLIFSGLMAGLAGITKTPALLLPPLAGLSILLLGWWQKTPFKQIVQQGLVWIGAFAGTAVFLFPALWSSPLSVFNLANNRATQHLEEALRPTFFWGNVTYDHGPLFYPVAILFRLSPAVVIGLLGAAYAAWRGERSEERGVRSEEGGRISLFSLRSSLFALPSSLFPLLLWSALFLALITAAAKKFDRYALPVLLPLMVVAAMGFQFPVSSFQFRVSRFTFHVSRFTLLALHALYLLPVLLYPLMGYNWLLGGAWGAKQVMPIGWGEGISAAGRWLAQQEGVEGKTAVSGIAPALAPFFPGTTLLWDDKTVQQADYVIITANGRQMDAAAQDRLTADFQLLHTVWFGGLEQAWIYQNPHPQPHNVLVTPFAQPYFFGNAVQLLGSHTTADSETVSLYARWQLQQIGRYKAKLTLSDTNGHSWASLETDLLNEVYFYPEFWQPGESPTIRYTVELPPGLPPAEYTLSLALFAAESGAQLPLLTADGSFQGMTFADSVTIAPPVEPPAVPELNIPLASDAAWLNGRLWLLGYTPLPDVVLAGDRALVELYWQGTAVLPPGLQLVFSLDGGQTFLPLSRYPSQAWQPGTTLHEKYSLPVPPDLPAGQYAVQLAVATAENELVPGTAVLLGQLNVVATDRLFTLPPDMPTILDYRLGGTIYLRGLAGGETAVSPGQTLSLTLYWQTSTQPSDLYSAFLHILRPDGTILAQDDHWPGGLPSTTWAAGQVIPDEYHIILPPDTPPDEYRMVVGLYHSASGVRLPVQDATGANQPHNQIVLPLLVTVTNE